MRITVVALLTALWLIPAGARAQQAEVQERIDALERELALLKRELEVEGEVQASVAPPPKVGVGPDGFFVRSADGKYQFRFRGYMQFDSRWFSEADESALPDTFYLRRVRPIFEGTLASFIDFRIMPDFANSTLVLQDAYTNLRFSPEVQLQVGKFKSPFGLERLESATAIWFVERALPTLFCPNRDLGVMLQGMVREGMGQYQIAFLNGNNDTATTDSEVGDDKDLAARLFLHPFQETSIGPLQGLGVGVATTYGRPQGTPGAIRAIGGQPLFQFQPGTTFEGERARWSPQAYWYWGQFALLSEYVTNSTGFQAASGETERAYASAWQIAGAWVITGENTSWRGVLPSRPFDLAAGELGAFEIAARFSRLDLDPDLFDGNVFLDGAKYPEATEEWTIGLNWHLNRFVKLAFNYEHIDFTSPAGNPDKPSEGVFLTRLQLAY